MREPPDVDDEKDRLIQELAAMTEELRALDREKGELQPTLDAASTDPATNQFDRTQITYHELAEHSASALNRVHTYGKSNRVMARADLLHQDFLIPVNNKHTAEEYHQARVKSIMETRRKLDEKTRDAAITKTTEAPAAMSSSNFKAPAITQVTNPPEVSHTNQPAVSVERLAPRPTELPSADEEGQRNPIEEIIGYMYLPYAPCFNTDEGNRITNIVAIKLPADSHLEKPISDAEFLRNMSDPEWLSKMSAGGHCRGEPRFPPNLPLNHWRYSGHDHLLPK